MVRNYRSQTDEGGQYTNQFYKKNLHRVCHARFFPLHQGGINLEAEERELLCSVFASSSLDEEVSLTPVQSGASGTFFGRLAVKAVATFQLKESPIICRFSDDQLFSWGCLELQPCFIYLGSWSTPCVKFWKDRCLKIAKNANNFKMGLDKSLD